MKYVYDIILNFNNKFYDFYEWNESDDIDYIKKIPVIKVSNETINDFKYYDIFVDNNLLNHLVNNTEIYKEVGIEILSNILLLVSTDQTIGVIFDDNGKVIYKSSLLISEELDIIKYMDKNNEEIIKYQKCNKISCDFIRNDEIKNIFIKKELDLIEKANDLSKVKYIYYEIFNKIDSLDIMIEKLRIYSNENIDELYNLLVLCKGMVKSY